MVAIDSLTAVAAGVLLALVVGLSAWALAVGLRLRRAATAVQRG